MLYDRQTRSMLQTDQPMPQARQPVGHRRAEPRRLDRHLLRPAGAGGQGAQLAPDRARQGLVHDPAPLQPAPAVLRQELAAERDRALQPRLQRPRPPDRALSPTPPQGALDMRGTGRATFAAILLLIVGTLNVIYGIGALDSANIFVDDKRFILDNLNTLGWVLIVLGDPPVHRRLLADERQHLRPGHRYHRAAASARSGRCCRSAAATRGGRWPASSCASGSSTASSSSDRTSTHW